MTYFDNRIPILLPANRFTSSLSVILHDTYRYDRYAYPLLILISMHLPA